MGLTQILAEVLLPVYAVVAVGYVLGRRSGTGPEGLSTISYWVLGPAFIFDVLASAELSASLVGGVVGATLVVMAGSAVLAAGIAHLTRGDHRLTGASVLTSIHGNVGNFGLAMSGFAFGTEAFPIAGLVLVTVNTVGIATGVAWAEAGRVPVWQAIVRGAVSPLALAVPPALLVNVAGSELPMWLDRPVTLLAAALIPVMLLMLGLQVAAMPGPAPSTLSLGPIAVKLLIAPLIAIPAAAAFGLSGLAADVVVLQAAMPAAVFTALIAMEHDLAPDFVTQTILGGTAVAALTIPIVIAFL